MARLELVQEVEAHEDRVWEAQWSPCGRYLASCSGDRSVAVWGRGGDGEGLRLLTRLEDAHRRTVRRLAWAPGGRCLAAASFDATVSVWKNVAGVFNLVGTLEGHDNEVKGVAWDCSGNLLATCSRDKTVWVWEMQEEDFECVSVMHGHSADVKAVLWHPNKELLFSASYDDTVRSWVDDGDDDWTCSQTLAGHASTVWEVAFRPAVDRPYLVSCSADLDVKVWKDEGKGDDSDFTLATTIAGQHKRCIYSVDVNSADQVVTGAGDNTIRVFQLTEDAASSELLATNEKAHAADVNCVRWCTSDPTLVASASDDGTIKLWRLVPE